MTNIFVPFPKTQILFSNKLEQIRKLYLQDALFNTVSEISIKRLDAELSEFVSEKDLQKVAKRGLRGELLFPVPCIFEKKPYLIGYYRLLLGFSQKEFYTSSNGLSRFISMETQNILSSNISNQLPRLSEKLIQASSALLNSIQSDKINLQLLHELTMLTLGPQLRGSANVTKGVKGMLDVFSVIFDIVSPAIVDSSPKMINLINAAGRHVTIEFSSDPDIVIREVMTKDSTRNIIAIEVKGGTDYSNIHNRLGEAEKSHQKAKAAGYVECWTVVNVENFNKETAQKESPATNRFYKISSLKNNIDEEYDDFKNRIISLTGIK